MWHITRMTFMEYIDSMLVKKGWTRNELAARAGLSSSYFTMVAKGARKPGADACQKIAVVLQVSEAEVFRYAGVSTERPTMSPLTEQLLSLTGKLNDDETQDLIDLALAKIARKSRATENIQHS